MYTIKNPVEIAKTIQQMDLKNPKSFDKVPKANYPIDSSKVRIENNNVLRNEIRIKSEIEATCDSPISCLIQDELGNYSSYSFLNKLLRWT